MYHYNRTTITTTTLEMTRSSELRPAREAALESVVQRAALPCPELNRFLYTAVGGHWYWTDRLSWTYNDWLAYLTRLELETWVATVEGTPAGYFELEKQAGDQVEIAYFGLLPQFIGKGLGGRLLTIAIERAWEMGAKRVWVHTCTLDGPTALPNYLARGFRIVSQVTSEVDLPDRPPGPWPNSSSDPE